MILVSPTSFPQEDQNWPCPMLRVVVYDTSVCKLMDTYSCVRSRADGTEIDSPMTGFDAELRIQWRFQIE